MLRNAGERNASGVWKALAARESVTSVELMEKSAEVENTAINWAVESPRKKSVNSMDKKLSSVLDSLQQPAAESGESPDNSTGDLSSASERSAGVGDGENSSADEAEPMGNFMSTESIDSLLHLLDDDEPVLEKAGGTLSSPTLASSSQPQGLGFSYVEATKTRSEEVVQVQEAPSGAAHKRSRRRSLGLKSGLALPERKLEISEPVLHRHNSQEDDVVKRRSSSKGKGSMLKMWKRSSSLILKSKKSSGGSGTGATNNSSSNHSPLAASSPSMKRTESQPMLLLQAIPRSGSGIICSTVNVILPHSGCVKKSRYRLAVAHPQYDLFRDSARSCELGGIKVMVVTDQIPCIDVAISSGRTLLHLALDRPSVNADARWQMIQYYIREKKGAVDIADDFGTTALHMACRLGCVRTIEALVSVGFSVHTRTTLNGSTPLHWLADSPHLFSSKLTPEEFMELHSLVIKFFSPARNCTSIKGQTALHFCILSHAQPQMIKFLVKQVKIDLDYVDFLGHTALSYAIEHFKVDAIRCLLSLGARVSSYDIAFLQDAASGNLPSRRSHAVSAHNTVIMQAVSLVADACHTTISAGSAPHSSSSSSSDVNSSTNTDSQLDQTSGDEAQFLAACCRGDFMHVGQVIERAQKEEDTQRWLLIRNEEGWEALNLAMVGGHLPVVQALLEWRESSFGSKKTSLPILPDGSSILHIAVLHSCVEVVRYLCKKYRGHSLINKATSTGGFTPLHFACMSMGVSSKNVIVAQALLDAGANVNVRDCQGTTAAHYAMAMQDKELIELLVSRGAEFTVFNDHRFDPAGFAFFFLSRPPKFNDLLDRAALVDRLWEDSSRFGSLSLKNSSLTDALATVLLRRLASLPLPAGSKGLRTLNLSQNALTRIPAVLLQFSTLQNIRLSENPSLIAVEQTLVARTSNAKQIFTYLETRRDGTLALAAAKKGDRRFLEQLLNDGVFPSVDTKLRNKDRQTLLLAVCSDPSTERSSRINFVLWALDQQGGDVSICDERGHSALYAAAQIGCLDTLTLLLQRNAPFDQRTRSGRTFLHALMRSKNFEVSAQAVTALMGHLETIIARQPDFLNWKAFYTQRTPLHELLHSSRNDGKSMLALMNVLLILPDTDANAVDSRHETVLDIALRRDDLPPAVPRFLLKIPRVQEPLSSAFKEDAVALLRSRAEAVDSRHLRRGQVSSAIKRQVENLPLQYSSSVEARLFASCARGQKNLFRRLCRQVTTRRHSVRHLMNMVDANKWSLLHIACRYGQLSAVRVLMAYAELRKPVYLERRYAKMGTALHLAARFQHALIVESLLDAGANADATNNDAIGAGPLLVAVEHCATVEAPCVKALLKGGANPAKKNSLGRNALHVAILAHHTNFLLLESLVLTLLTVDVSLVAEREDVDGLTPLEFAGFFKLNRNLQRLLQSAAHVHQEIARGNLKRLSLQDRGLSTRYAHHLLLPLKAVPTLQSLDLSRNNLTCVPDAILQLPNLKVLSLRRNPLLFGIEGQLAETTTDADSFRSIKKAIASNSKCSSQQVLVQFCGPAGSGKTSLLRALMKGELIAPHETPASRSSYSLSSSSSSPSSSPSAPTRAASSNVEELPRWESLDLPTPRKSGKPGRKDAQFHRIPAGDQLELLAWDITGFDVFQTIQTFVDPAENSLYVIPLALHGDCTTRTRLVGIEKYIRWIANHVRNGTVVLVGTFADQPRERLWDTAEGEKKPSSAASVAGSSSASSPSIRRSLSIKQKDVAAALQGPDADAEAVMRMEKQRLIHKKLLFKIVGAFQTEYEGRVRVALGPVISSLLTPMTAQAAIRAAMKQNIGLLAQLIGKLAEERRQDITFRDYLLAMQLQEILKQKQKQKLLPVMQYGELRNKVKNDAHFVAVADQLDEALVSSLLQLNKVGIISFAAPSHLRTRLYRYRSTHGHKTDDKELFHAIPVFLDPQWVADVALALFSFPSTLGSIYEVGALLEHLESRVRFPRSLQYRLAVIRALHHFTPLEVLSTGENKDSLLTVWHRLQSLHTFIPSDVAEVPFVALPDENATEVPFIRWYVWPFLPVRLFSAFCGCVLSQHGTLVRSWNTGVEFRSFADGITFVAEMRYTKEHGYVSVRLLVPQRGDRGMERNCFGAAVLPITCKKAANFLSHVTRELVTFCRFLFPRSSEELSICVPCRMCVEMAGGRPGRAVHSYDLVECTELVAKGHRFILCPDCGEQDGLLEPQPLSLLTPDVMLCDVYETHFNKPHMEMLGLLGRGAFGDVFKVRLKEAPARTLSIASEKQAYKDQMNNGNPVSASGASASIHVISSDVVDPISDGNKENLMAAKQISLSYLEKSGESLSSVFQEFMHECRLMHQFHTPYILSVKGWMLDPSPCIFLDLAGGGDLYEFIHDPVGLVKVLDDFCQAIGANLVRETELTLETFEALHGSYLDQCDRLRPELHEDVQHALDEAIEAFRSYWLKPTEEAAVKRDDLVKYCLDTFKDFVSDHRTLTTDLLLRIGFDVAAGLYHMHSRLPPIAHLDLKTPNILLSRPTSQQDVIQAPLCKLADFGLSLPFVVTSHEPSSLCPLPPHMQNLNPRWAPPEVLESAHFSCASDIYGFALVLWELATTNRPYSEFSGALAQAEMQKAICSGYRPLIPPYVIEPVADLITSCWRPVPEERPTAHQIIATIYRIAHDLQLPVAQYLFVPFT